MIRRHPEKNTADMLRSPVRAAGLVFKQVSSTRVDCAQPLSGSNGTPGPAFCMKASCLTFVSVLAISPRNLGTQSFRIWEPYPMPLLALDASLIPVVLDRCTPTEPTTHFQRRYPPRYCVRCLDNSSCGWIL
ncbi:hypothetical protein PMIN06_003224 [Paraphaeosphaeria minitans]